VIFFISIGIVNKIFNHFFLNTEVSVFPIKTMKTMKNVLIIFAILFLQVGVFAQNSDVPVNIQKALKAKFPSAQDVEWTSGGTFLASFWAGNDYKEATFSKSGEWLETSTVLAEDKLPVNVMTSLTKNLGETYITYVLKMEKKDGSQSYIIDLSTETENLQVITDLTGKVLKKMVIADEEDGGF
jgi:hypothetical protein